MNYHFAGENWEKPILRWPFFSGTNYYFADANWDKLIFTETNKSELQGLFSMVFFKITALMFLTLCRRSFFFINKMYGQWRKKCFIVLVSEWHLKILLYMTRNYLCTCIPSSDLDQCRSNENENVESVQSGLILFCLF